MNRATSRYAARMFRRQVITLGAADRLASRAAFIVRSAKADTLRVLRFHVGTVFHQWAGHAVRDVWTKALGEIRDALVDGIALAAQRASRAAYAELEHEFGRPTPAPSTEAPMLVPDPFPNFPKRFSREDFQKRLGLLTVAQQSETDIQKLLKSNAWKQRLANQTSLASPQDIMDVLQPALAGGKTIEQVATDLTPVLGGVEAAAARVARQETMWAVHRANMDVWEDMGPQMVPGYTVHAVMDDRTRPAHAERDGDTYWKDPDADQKSMAEMPHPPYEADGTLAYNCRCWVTPIFALDPKSSPKALAKLDPDTVGAWFDGARPAVQRAAVGPKRLAAANKLLDRPVTWADFLGDDGKLLTTNQLIAKLTPGVTAA